MVLSASAIDRGHRLIHRGIVGSTNEELLFRARAGERGPLWFVADRQSTGRGRAGRSWESPAGNLYASLLLSDPCDPRHASHLGFVAGVALVRALDHVVGVAAGFVLKWPNDVLYRGAKLAGILVEGTQGPAGFAAVIGFGVNCASHPEGLPYPATHLAALAGERGPRDSLFAALSTSVADALALWARGERFADIRRAWLERALPQGSPLVVARADRRLAGRFYSIGDDGRLILETDHGLVTAEAGDVFLADRGMTAAS